MNSISSLWILKYPLLDFIVEECVLFHVRNTIRGGLVANYG